MKNNTLTTHETLNYFQPHSFACLLDGPFVDFDYERLRRDKNMFS